MADPGLLLRGERVTLQSTKESDLPAILALWNDPAVMQWVGFPMGIGYDAAKLAEWLIQLQASPNRFHFSVYAEGPEYCGEVFCRLDRTHRRAGLDIKFVPRAQGRGLSRDALQTLIRWIFETLGEADAVWTEPWERNLAARTLYYSCGLRQIPRPSDLPDGPSYWELSRRDWRTARGGTGSGEEAGRGLRSDPTGGGAGPGYYARELGGERLRACYELAPPAVKAYLESEIAFVLERIRPDGAVLELGCGYGRVLRRIVHPRRTVTGIDTAVRSLAVAREYVGELPSLSLSAMDGSRLAFRDRVFDLTLCIQNGISAFGVDRLHLIREAARVTRHGGTVLFSSYAASFWDDRLAWFRLQAAAGLIGEIDDAATGNGVIVCKDGFRASTVGPEEFARLAAEAGLTARIEEVDGSSLFCEIDV